MSKMNLQTSLRKAPEEYEFEMLKIPKHEFHFYLQQNIFTYLLVFGHDLFLQQSFAVGTKTQRSCMKRNTAS